MVMGVKLFNCGFNCGDVTLTPITLGRLKKLPIGQVMDWKSTVVAVFHVEAGKPPADGNQNDYYKQSDAVMLM